jgi:uncharacterized heparinase superfamily protein
MSVLRKARRYWETLRHLRSPQIWGRLAHRWYSPSPPPPAPAPPCAPPGTWTPPARRLQSLIGAGRFVFLHAEGDLQKDGWDGPGQEKLWRYNQHYFDDLNAHGAASRSPWHQALLTDWIHQNPPASGTGWESYPTSLRIVNWIKWSLAGGATDAAFLDSLAMQARWLSRRLETHLLGNHLFVNAKALVFAGHYFSGDEAASWRRTGHELLKREIPEQILPDGGQFERSPMYHALAYEDMLDLYNIERCFAAVSGGPDDAINGVTDCQRLLRMASWLHAMSHPNGELALFNDTAEGIAPSVQELDAYAQRLGLESPPGPHTAYLDSSGYIRLQEGAAVVLFDVGPVGPDYLPAHAHADTLSLELSLDGTRVLVNSGTSLYAEGPERSRQRGTAAHNTVVVNGQDSSEVWGSFRVARRARPCNVRLEQEAGAQRASGAHDGYARLPGKPVHVRNLTLGPDSCVVKDCLEGSFQHAQSRFHFHPDVAVSVDAHGHQGHCRLSDGRILSWRSHGVRTARVEASTWHPEFGVTIPNQCLILDWSDRQCAIELRWDGASGE